MTWNDPIVILATIAVAVLSLSLLGALLIPQLPTIRQLLVGVSVPPTLVASVRALADLVGGAGLTLLTAWVTGWRDERLVAIGLAAVSVLKVAWGLLDGNIKPKSNDVPAAPSTPEQREIAREG